MTSEPPAGEDRLHEALARQRHRAGRMRFRGALARALDGPPGELASRGLHRLRSLYRRMRQAVGLPV